jgi:hypothetical protein
MIKEIEIKIPQSYADVSLKQYLALQKELTNYEGDSEAQLAVLVSYLCDLDTNYLAGLSKEDYNLITYDLMKFLNETQLPFQQFVTIDGVEYGFEPNLSNMAYGAYLDITRYDVLQIDNNWAKIMSILYRPVEKKQGKNYSIKTYSGEIDEQKWLNVSMDVHFGALFFFVNLLMDLVKGIPSYLNLTELPPNIRSILERSGKAIRHLSNLRTEIL